MPNIAKAGSLICVDRGEYSDYRVLGFFVALRDFDPRIELAEHLKEQPEQTEDYAFEGDMYLSYLLSKGLLLEIDYSTLYLGAYAQSDAIRFTPFRKSYAD